MNKGSLRKLQYVHFYLNEKPMFNLLPVTEQLSQKEDIQDITAPHLHKLPPCIRANVICAKVAWCYNAQYQKANLISWLWPRWDSCNISPSKTLIFSSNMCVESRKWPLCCWSIQPGERKRGNMQCVVSCQATAFTVIQKGQDIKGRRRRSKPSKQPIIVTLSLLYHFPLLEVK